MKSDVTNSLSRVLFYSSLLLISLAFSCRNTEERSQKPSCSPEIESLDDTYNRESYDDLMGRLKPHLFYAMSSPNSLEWTIENNNLVLQNEAFALQYDETLHHWQLIDQGGLSKGNLKIYRNSCGQFSFLEFFLSDTGERGRMFVPTL